MDYSGQDSAPQYIESSHLQGNDDSDLFFMSPEGVDCNAVPTYFSRMPESYRHSPGRCECNNWKRLGFAPLRPWMLRFLETDLSF